MGAIQILPVEAMVDLLEKSLLQPCQVLFHLSIRAHPRNNLLASRQEKVSVETQFQFLWQSPKSCQSG